MKFSGNIGFWDTDSEVSPDVYRPQIVERHYIGDIIRDNRRFQSNNTQNESFQVTNQLSIIADMYAQTHLSSIRYVELKGQKIKVSSITVDYPRLTLELGGVWNGEE